MDENLVGYLLKALDADEQRTVEMQLSDHPEAQRRLEHLRRRLDLLACDAVDADPPDGLWVRTLAAIAEHKCRDLPRAPLARPEAAVAGRAWWRRADLLVAAALLLIVGGVGATWLIAARDRERLVACKDNLRRFHYALWNYSEDHDGRFPEVGSQAPTNVAGIFVPILNDAGVLPSSITLGCPGPEGPTTSPPPTLTELNELYRTNPMAFSATASTLGGCYAYSLGYREGDGPAARHRGLTAQMDKRLPILADRPPAPSTPDFAQANSPNHGGRGQNVLFIGGNVEFCTTRDVGLDRDDIFLNRERQPRAGLGPRDTVLGRSDATPYPPRPED